MVVGIQIIYVHKHNVLLNIGHGAGEGRKKRGQKSNLPKTFDDNCVRTGNKF